MYGSLYFHSSFSGTCSPLGASTFFPVMFTAWLFVRLNTLMVGMMARATEARLAVDATCLNAGKELMKGLDSRLQAIRLI